MGNAAAGPRQTDSNEMQFRQLRQQIASDEFSVLSVHLLLECFRMLHWHLQHLILLSQPAFAAGSSFEGRMAPAPSPDLDFEMQNKSSSSAESKFADRNRLELFCQIAEMIEISLFSA